MTLTVKTHLTRTMCQRIIQQGPGQSRADGDTGEEQSRADGGVGEDECRQRAEQPRSGRDTEPGPASCHRPKRKIKSTKDTRHKDFICD